MTSIMELPMKRFAAALSSFLRGTEDAVGSGTVERERLLEQDVLTSFEGLDRPFAMKTVRQADIWAPIASISGYVGK